PYASPAGSPPIGSPARSGGGGTMPPPAVQRMAFTTPPPGGLPAATAAPVWPAPDLPEARSVYHAALPMPAATPPAPPAPVQRAEFTESPTGLGMTEIAIGQSFGFGGTGGPRGPAPPSTYAPPPRATGPGTP